MVTNTLGSALGVEPNSLPINDKKPISLNAPESFGKEAKSYLQTMEPLIQQSAQAEGDLETMKAKQKAMEIGGMAKAQKTFGENVKGEMELAEQKELQYPRPEFHPTQENAASLGALFSMVSTIGMVVGASGKRSATNAMNAMTGMLKGWKEGRKDLYDKEVKEFDKEYKRITDVRNEIQKKLEKSIQLQTIDKDGANLAAQEAAALFGANSVGQNIVNTKGAAKAIEYLNAGYNLDAQYKKIQSEANNRTLRMQEMMLAKIDREVLNESRAYPNLKMSDLTNISKEGTKRIVGSLEQLRETEHIVDFIEKNPNSVGAMAKLRNIINLDAINSINTGNEFNDAITRSATIDKNIDDAQNKGKITRSDAQAAKILQKQLFTLALADVQSSGQRGTVYLDKQFATLYDQASSLDTLIKILHQREISADRRLSVFGMDIKNRNDKNEEFKFYQTGPDQWLNQKFPVYTLDEAKKVVKNKSASPGSWYRGTDSVLRQF